MRKQNNNEFVDITKHKSQNSTVQSTSLTITKIIRRFKKNNSEASAQTNRALLERLLMKNASSGGGGVSYEGRRAWSANPAPMRGLAASRSVGGTPICLRRTKTTTRASHLLSPQSRLVFERNHQVYPAVSILSWEFGRLFFTREMCGRKERYILFPDVLLYCHRHSSFTCI